MSTALLLAEPGPATRDFLERHLRADGFRVVGAVAGCEALDLAEREQPSPVLLDTALPAESGLAPCRRPPPGGPGRRGAAEPRPARHGSARRVGTRALPAAPPGRAGPLVGPRRAGDPPGSERGRRRRPRARLRARLRRLRGEAVRLRRARGADP